MELSIEYKSRCAIQDLNGKKYVKSFLSEI